MRDEMMILMIHEKSIGVRTEQNIEQNIAAYGVQISKSEERKKSVYD